MRIGSKGEKRGVRVVFDSKGTRFVWAGRRGGGDLKEQTRGEGMTRHVQANQQKGGGRVTSNQKKEGKQSYRGDCLPFPKASGVEQKKRDKKTGEKTNNKSEVEETESMKKKTIPGKGWL